MNDVVTNDLLCAVCDYNLRAQPVDGLCPECDAIHFPRLAASAPRWRTSLLDSVTVPLVAIALIAAGGILDRGRDRPHYVLPQIAGWAATWFAIWLLTRPEPGGRCSNGSCRWR